MLDFIIAPWSIEIMHWTLKELSVAFVWLFILYVAALYVWAFLQERIDNWMQLLGLVVVIPILILVWTIVFDLL